jgi:alpha-glucosidase
MLMTRATYEGLLRLRPDRRPFILTRASFAGGQRYSALWPGDNTSDWSQLRASLPVLMGMGLSGLSFVGVDIGGFAGTATPEMFTRWQQVGAFYPFMRDHTEFSSPDKEPWVFGPRHEAINKRAIELRYELLPHIYTVMRETAETGLPAMRPLFLEFPGDPKVVSIDDQFLFGSDLMIAPVLHEAVAKRDVYLPKGDWYDFWTGARQKGGDFFPVSVTLESLPIYVRAGAFVFRQPVIQHTGLRAGQPVTVEVYPAERSTGALYEDDGETLGYQRGAFALRRFSQARNAKETTIDVAASEGSWRPAARDLVVAVHWDGAPARVLLDGAAVADWKRRGAFVEVRLRDDCAAHHVRIVAGGA